MNTFLYFGRNDVFDLSNMKKLLLFILAFSSFGFIKAQQSAVTETGEEVILYDDGTWIYKHKDTILAEDIHLNPVKFTRDSNSTFLLKSTRINIGCYLDPKQWTFKRMDESEAAEYEINSINLGLYGMMITEKLDLPLESLANIALDNAHNAAPDVKVTAKEYRIVNGLKVMMMRMTGTIQDIRFSYYGYYYSTDKGATQFLVYSSEDLVDEHITEIEQLLNGLVKIKD
jgi:hypothetical protein